MLVMLWLAGVLAWSGIWFHDFREFPGTLGITPNVVLEGLVYVGLIAFVARRSRAWPARASLVIVVLVLTVGNALSVLPLPIWPWAPDQSASHYAAHALSAAAQILVIVLAIVNAPGVRSLPTRIQTSYWEDRLPVPRLWPPWPDAR